MTIVCHVYKVSDKCSGFIWVAASIPDTRISHWGQMGILKVSYNQAISGLMERGLPQHSSSKNLFHAESQTKSYRSNNSPRLGDCTQPRAAVTCLGCCGHHWLACGPAGWGSWYKGFSRSNIKVEGESQLTNCSVLHIQCNLHALPLFPRDPDNNYSEK